MDRIPWTLIPGRQATHAHVAHPMSRDITQAEYDEKINMLAEVAVEAVEEGHYSDISEAVWEVVDGEKWISHFSYNTTVLDLAEHEPQEWKHLVSDDDSWWEVIQKMAYKAMENDVYFTAEELREGE